MLQTMEEVVSCRIRLSKKPIHLSQEYCDPSFVSLCFPLPLRRVWQCFVCSRQDLHRVQGKRRWGWLQSIVYWCWLISWCNHLVAEPYALLSQRCEVSQIILLLLLQVSYCSMDWWNWWHDHSCLFNQCSTPSATWARTILTCWLNIPRTFWTPSALVSRAMWLLYQFQFCCSCRSSDEPWPLHIAAITYSELPSQSIYSTSDVVSIHCSQNCRYQ